MTEAGKEAGSFKLLGTKKSGENKSALAWFYTPRSPIVLQAIKQLLAQAKDQEMMMMYMVRKPAVLECNNNRIKLRIHGGKS